LAQSTAPITAARLVLDTNVVASAMLWDGPPRQLLHAAHSKRIQLFASAALLQELNEILARRKFAKKIAASGLTLEQLVHGYATLAGVVRPAAIAPTIQEDPDDDAVLATAVAARAKLIVSGDGHLLTLGQFQGIAILTVRQVLEQLAQQP
jgi:putative PIN family toxin of toxin-antitoxin system